MQTKRIAVYAANCTWLAFLNVHLNEFHARRLILFKIPIYVRNNMRFWSVISYCLQWALPSLSVTLSNILSLLIYSAAFV